VLTARKPADRELIAALPGMGDAGTVIIDDFHRLEEPVKHGIADYLKALAMRRLRRPNSRGRY